MSCHLRTTGRIQGVDDLRTFFFPHLKKSKEEEENAETWSDAGWGWEAEENKENVTTDAVNSWLLDCHVGASPSGDHLAVGFDNKLVVLQSKFTGSTTTTTTISPSGLDDENCASFVVVFKDVVVRPSLLRDGGVAGSSPQERVSCVACVPIASTRRSGLSGAPDWTVVLVGFTSGSISFFTESGVLLLSQVFHEGERVERIKCYTANDGRGGASTVQEELTVQYSGGVVVSIDGFGLVQTLRACRNQAARASAAGGASFQSDAAPPPIAYRKWSLKSQDNVVDHVAVGLGTTCVFDQLQTASAFLGNRPFRPSATAASVYVATGAGPFVSFYAAREGAAHSLIAEVSSFVSTKISSMLSGATSWLGFGGKGGVKGDATGGGQGGGKPPKIEPASPLNISHALPDMRRHGESIVLAPSASVGASGHGRHLAATTDSFGRVILVDVARKVAIRIWKGYRDAQLGFLQVQEDEAVTDPRRPSTPGAATRSATFLVIYAPRRGILEVWTMEQGPRVGAFNVNKWCRLLYPGHEMLGAYSSSSLPRRRRRESSSSSSRRHRLQFVDPDGAVKTLEVPFHLALTSKNSKRAEDLHLLKTFKIMLRDHRLPAESSSSSSSSSSYPPPSSRLDAEILAVLDSLKSHSVRRQALERLLQTPFVGAEAMRRYCGAARRRAYVVDVGIETDGAGAVEEATPSPTNDSDLEVDARLLVRFCDWKTNLLETYSKLVENYGEKGEPEPNVKSEEIKEPEPEVKEVKPEEVTEPEPELSASEFLASLNLSTHEDKTAPTLIRLAQKPAPPSPEILAPASVRFEEAPDTADAEDKASPANDAAAPPSVAVKRRRPISVCSFLASFRVSRDEATSVDGKDDGEKEEGETVISSSSSSQICLSVDKKEGLFDKVADLFFASALTRGLSSSSSSLDELLHSSAILPDHLLDLLLRSWLSLSSADLSLDSPRTRRFARLLEIVTRLKPGLVGVVVDAGESTPSPWWTRARDACAEAANDALPAAMTAALIGRAVGDRLTSDSRRKKAEEMAEGEEEERAASTEDWIPIDREMEAWNLLIKRLEDAMALSILFSFKPPKTRKAALKKEGGGGGGGGGGVFDDDPIHGLSVAAILEAGRGGVPELVARWAARRRVTAAELLGEDTARRSGVDSAAAVEVVDFESVSTLEEALERLVRPRMPQVARADVLAANCCWECAVQWNKGVDGHVPKGDEPLHASFRRSLSYLGAIENAALASGVASLLWHAFAAKKVEALATTMEKTKKAPKERLCRQAMGPEMDAKAAEAWLPLARELLEMLLEAGAETSYGMAWESDPAWHTPEGHASLVELALQQKPPRHPAVARHSLLLLLMEAFFVFQIKSVRILADLFDAEDRAAFFLDLHVPSASSRHGGSRKGKKSGAASTGVDGAMQLTREQLLRRILSAAAEHLLRLENAGTPATGDAEIVVAASSGPRLDPSLTANRARAWFSRVLGYGAGADLGRDLGVDADILRRHLVMELYSNGMDSRAEETLLTVNDKREVGAELLILAGQRVAWYLYAGDDPKLAAKQCDQLSLLPAHLTKWLKTLEWRELRRPETPLTSTAVLLGRVVDCLDEDLDRDLLKTALALVDSVQRLVD